MTDGDKNEESQVVNAMADMRRPTRLVAGIGDLLWSNRKECQKYSRTATKVALSASGQPSDAVAKDAEVVAEY